MRSWRNSVHADTVLKLGDVRADELAARFGTPLLVLDLRAVDAAVAAMQRACAPFGVRISYAGKALMLVPLVRRFVAAGLSIDVCSLGELATAEGAGVPPERIALHGAGKTDAELQAVCDARVGRIIVDGLDELRRLAAHAEGRGVKLLLRLNTGIEAHTHDFIRTAGDNSKFGFAPHEEAAAIEILRTNPHLHLVGLHAHVGSQIYESQPFAANALVLASAMARFAEAGFVVTTLVLGGGFGIAMHPDAADELLDLHATVAGFVRTVQDAARANGLAMPRLEIEPGRALVGAAGTSLYRVLAIKRFAQRTFAITDGSMADNPRPALYNAYHHITSVVPSSDTHDVTVCGRSCENDEFGNAQLPRVLRAGDLLAVASTGAYTYSMASNYNRFARPAVVAVGDGEPRLFARRETIEQLLQNDVDA